MAIIISKNGKNAKKVEQSHFAQEDYLQQYIYNNPDAVPVYDIEENVRLLIVAREFPTPSGPIDALGIDQSGNIYLIETKLYKNSDKRTVVAQVLDYGASLWRSSIDFNEFTSELAKHTNKQFNKGLSDIIGEFFTLDADEALLILDSMRTNLSSGTFKFVILMDKVHDQLKDLILFLNQNSKFDVFAVELEYYQHEDFEIMIPKIHGTGVKKDLTVKPIVSARSKWDETRFFEHAMKKLNETDLRVVRKLLEFSKDEADIISWGTGVTYGSFNPKFLRISDRSLYTVTSSGVLKLNFGWLDDDETALKAREAFRNELEARKLFTIPQNYLKHSPEYQIDKWRGKVDNFIEVVKSLISESTPLTQDSA